MESTTDGASAPHGLLGRFVRVFAGDQIDLLWTIISDDCEWSIMATGEHFRGPDQIRGLIDQVQKARDPSAEARVTIKDAFAAGDYLCLEFLRQGLVTQGFASDPAAPAAGSLFEIDFCVTAQVRDGKIVRVREYFDHTHFGTPPAQRTKFFS